MDKEWLFEENIRLNRLEQELKEKQTILKLEQEKLAGEKKVFEQQKQVLEIAFQKLAADKEMFRAEVKKQKQKEQQWEYEHEEAQGQAGSKAVFRGPGYFGGVTGYSSLKKRYKELMKIFHPDNVCGDTKTLLRIQAEYESIKSKYYEA